MVRNDFSQLMLQARCLKNDPTELVAGHWKMLHVNCGKKFIGILISLHALTHIVVIPCAELEWSNMALPDLLPCVQQYET